MAHMLDTCNKKLVSIGLKPINRCTVCFYYMPIKGCACHSILAVQMLNPDMFERFSFLLVPRYISLTNACLMNSVIGSSLYLYSRPHLFGLKVQERIPLCLYGAVMFNLGSMLLWALGRTIAPENTFLRTLLGLLGSAGVVVTARRYISIIDSYAPKPKCHKT